MDAKVINDFKVWMARLGLHGKQVAEAGRLIGHGDPSTSQKRFRGERDLSRTERLAMAAVRAGLPEWTPETDQEIADLAELRAIVSRFSRRASS